MRKFPEWKQSKTLLRAKATTWWHKGTFMPATIYEEYLKYILPKRFKIPCIYCSVSFIAHALLKSSVQMHPSTQHESHPSVWVCVLTFTGHMLIDDGVCVVLLVGRKWRVGDDMPHLPPWPTTTTAGAFGADQCSRCWVLCCIHPPRVCVSSPCCRVNIGRGVGYFQMADGICNSVELLTELCKCESDD